MPNWFEQLMGFEERSPEHVRSNLSLDGNRITSKINGQSYDCGRLETPTLGELRTRLELEKHLGGRLHVAEVIGDVQELHQQPENAGAVFQVASQFNLLEMVSPNVTPEEGVGIYEYDRTQGPACAIACGAGTIYRNYLVEIDGQAGQTADRQIDCLADISRALANDGNPLWRMTNGYALPSREGLETVAAKLFAMPESELEELRSKLRVGVQADAQVTLGDCEHRVTQVYCSALPVAYSGHSTQLWRPFAQLILDAAYEATFCVAALNAVRAGNNRLYLTLLGGGAFGNDEQWIIGAIKRSLDRFRNANLDVRIVSYRYSKPAIRELLK
jgi:hypothetical protein